MDNSRLDVLEPHAAALHDLAHVWKSVGPQPLYRDRFRHTLCAPDYQKTYDVLFGTRPYQWARTVHTRAKHLRRKTWPDRWAGPYVSEIPLPADAVVFPRKRGGLVVVSRQSACVIKRLRTPSSEARCTSEKNASDRAHDAGLETHIPTVYAHGTHASGGHYLHTSLAPNTRPFFERRRTYWRRWLASEGLPVLEQFYDAAGVRERPADALLVAAEHAISSSGAPDALHRLLECTRRARPQGQHAIVPYALTHGDLNPVHIHRSRSSWVLIDWGVMTYRPIWQELLLPYLRHPLDTQYGRADFWAWLRGETAPPELQANVRADLNLYIEWLRRWRNENVSLAELRYQILAVWLNLLTSRVQSSEKLQSCLQESPLDDLIGHPNVAIRHTAQTLRALGLTTIEGDT